MALLRVRRPQCEMVNGLLHIAKRAFRYNIILLLRADGNYGLSRLH
jgi:hypothetical protein